MSPLVDKAVQLSDEVSARAGEFETQRRIPRDLSDKFARAGFYHALVPREYGGLETHPCDFVDLVKTVARADGSAGWQVMIGATTGLLSASLPDEFAREIYGDAPGILTVGVTAPLGRADRVEGGYRVAGRWPFASGCLNADWICGGAFLFENGERVEGNEIHLMLFEKSQVEVEDTWHVSGLKGTGSHHIAVSEQFVPAGRSVVLGSRPRIARPLYQFPILGLLALGVSAVSVGIGYRARDAFLALASDKRPTGSSRTVAERALVQSGLAKATAALRSAETLVDSTIGSAWEVAAAGGPLPVEMKADLRLAAANATHAAVAAVDSLFRAGGGTAIYESSPLQQCLRDVHVTTQHIMVADPVFEVVGRVQLGLDPRSVL